MTARLSLLRCSEVRFGSFSTELVWTKRSLRSAMPPIATEFTRHDESFVVKSSVLSGPRMSVFAGCGHAVGKAMCEMCQDRAHAVQQSLDDIVG
jgi:hypothetical protein